MKDIYGGVLIFSILIFYYLKLINIISSLN